ncbi:MAG: response regulator [Thermodesulfobacteria bacterium]|nr:response regulator [Thermodesulfobacteriota bacterium]
MKKALLAVAKALALDFEKILDEEGFTILKAEDGQELVDLAREEKPDLIILERNLPVLDGLSAMLLLKNDEATKKIPIVAVCEGKCNQEEQARDAGCDAYLTRPLKADKIRQILRELT